MGYLERHPELTAAPEPKPLAKVPARPIKDLDLPVVRPPLQRRVLIALGVPVIAFAGYELYQYVLAPTIHHH
ncbi:hypothetical protein HII36_22220 [Nonomuraea sp. NN258]|uniref:hypothetical protein n=1 Tax=Nonomuraea antri TaxID=2730852 RepID=UPI001567E5C8|nr:hypothetical protein [Nonomuraea antri]NRQ34537.1 hypothetical protein [Nonomuraea antri]